MLKNPVSRESAKGAAKVAGTAAILTNPAATLVITATAEVLGVAIEALGNLGNKRTNELFDTELANQVVKKIKKSDDFAGFVYSIWQKHNLESSKERREYLKNFLKSEAYKTHNSFENFSRIEYTIQNVNLRALGLLRVFHSTEVRRTRPQESGRYLLNLTELMDVLIKQDFNMPEADVEYNLNELVHHNLIAVSHGRFNGPLYNHTRLAFILLEYIDEGE